MSNDTKWKIKRNETWQITNDTWHMKHNVKLQITHMTHKTWHMMHDKYDAYYAYDAYWYDDA